ncbi:MAG TPA: DUF1080 domain-containing protein [Fimbriiglobus sp.]|jgi:hypothetical protein|nr:DUF1080 domain-containing protein [Fimbriiglobus sp.]
MPKVIRFAGLLLAAGMACGTAAADEKIPLVGASEKEAAEGWLTLFDGKTTFGWKVEGDVKVEKGALVIGGTKPSRAETTSRFSSGNVGGECSLAPSTPEGKSATFTGLLTEGLGPSISKDRNEIVPGMRGFVGTRDTGGEPKPLGFEVPAGVVLRVTGVRIQPVPRRFLPLLNGKDLSGWKVFQDPKRSKSKFAVTKDGELHVTDGPGDLQTEGKYADFVLQLECKTNGKHLNSGVFFRCVPDQYQNGYEAQIHNGFKGDDRTKPTDFGTGAIYRRVPARKVVANDNEWFTLTVVANGPRIATWVNGYQTADWTDDRKPADNPRQGLRTAAGHLSIQGHDPTTDILFRNIRIAELK